MGIVTFLIAVPTNYLVYVAVCPSPLLATNIDVNGIDFRDKNSVNLRLLALLALILPAITSIFFAHLVNGLMR